MDYTNVIGANIRYERKKRHLTIEDLSEILGIAPGFLGLIERGHRGTSLKNLVLISKFFSLTLDELITRNVLTDDAAVKENDYDVYTKEDTLVSLIKSLDSDEIDFIISIIKNLRKLAKNSTDPSDFDED